MQLSGRSFQRKLYGKVYRVNKLNLLSKVIRIKLERREVRGTTKADPE